MEVRALTQSEQKYTYAQSMQLEGQTGCIGHLRGDFDTSGYGFHTTWFDTREQWKTDEFKSGLDDVINALREDKGLLHNRYDMAAFAKTNPESSFKGSYCTEYGFRADTDRHAFLLRCNPTKGDYNFYCYCYVKEWLDKHISRAEKGIRFIDPHYKELFRMLDNRYALLFVRGERPVMDLKYDILKHPNVKLTDDGGKPPYIHGEPTQAVATFVFGGDIPKDAVTLNPVSTSYELLSDEDLEEIFNL